MSDPTEPTPSHGNPLEAAFSEAQETACPQAAGRLRQWLERAACALERAEKRIMDGFRVPPHGG